MQPPFWKVSIHQSFDSGFSKSSQKTPPQAAVPVDPPTAVFPP
jgi:hypothetical protein